MKQLLLFLLIILPLVGVAQVEGSARAVLSDQQSPILGADAAVREHVRPEFPYSKVLYMTKEELETEKFKYDATHNWDALKHVANFLFSPADIVRIADGHMPEVRPEVDDYLVLIQYGKEGIAYVQVIFHKDETYHDLLAFAKEQGQGLVETNSGELDLITFGYGGYAFELSNRVCHLAQTETRTTSTTTSKPTKVASGSRPLPPGSTTTTRTTSVGQTVDETYHIYQYIIRTGVEPWSPWLDKQADKQKVRDGKGKKKQSAADLM